MNDLPPIISFLSIRLFFGRLNVKWKAALLFSERYGSVPVLCVGPIAFVWRRYRRLS
ncbi:MAG: hypothetical protein ACTHJQ_01460 [Rhizobiaceae bacterium]